MNYFLKFSLLFIILFSVQSCMEFDVDEELNNNEPISTEQYFTIDDKKFYIDSLGEQNSLLLEHIPTGNEVEGAAVMIAGYDKTNPDIQGIITLQLIIIQKRVFRVPIYQVNLLNRIQNMVFMILHFVHMQ